MALTNGMPIESVSRILGHMNITTTQIYAKITTEKLNTDLTALGNSYTLSLVKSLVIFTLLRATIQICYLRFR